MKITEDRDPALDDYRRWLTAQGYRPRTITVRVAVIRALLQAAGKDRADQLDQADVLDYFGRDLAAWTRRKYLEHVEAFTRWRGLPSLTEGMRKPPHPRSVPRPVETEDLDAMLAVCTARTRAFLLLGCYAGLRSFEIAQVAVEDVLRLPAGPVLVVRGKGGRSDVVPIPMELWRELQPWCRAAGTGRLWDADAVAVRAAVKRAGRAAGVRVSSHQLRHWYGTHLYAESRDLLLTSQLMRHASPTTTAGYTRLSDLAGAQLVETLPAARSVGGTGGDRGRRVDLGGGVGAQPGL